MEAELDSAPVPSARPKAQKGAGKEPKKSQAGDKGGKGKGKGGKGKGRYGGKGGGGKGAGKFDGDCNYCHKYGHMERDCRLLDAHMELSLIHI